MGSFVIDLSAMTFGMPRALFPVLAVTVYDAGATGTGLLYAAVAAGSTVAALTTGWLLHARYLGRIVLVAVAVWGIFIAAAGLVDTIWPAAALFACAGAADSVSAVCRSTISQTLTPDRMRGRMSLRLQPRRRRRPAARRRRVGDGRGDHLARASRSSPAASPASPARRCVVARLPAARAYDAEAARARTAADAELALASA